jgi:glutamine synthetase
MKKALDELTRAENKARQITGAKEKAYFYKDTVRGVMDELRAPADELEMIVDKELWPIPTYGELLFAV